MNLIFLGAMIAIIGGVITAVGTWLHNKSSSEKTTRIENTGYSTNKEVIEIKKQNHELKIQSDKQLETIDVLRKENTDLHTKLVKSATETYNTITGGDSYCSLSFYGYFEGEPDKSYFYIANEGNYPLKNVMGKVYDLNYYSMTTPWIENGVKYFSIGDLEPHHGSETNIQFIKEKDKGVNLDAHIHAHNGNTIHKIRECYMYGRWLRAEKIESPHFNSMRIDKDYPEQNPKVIFQEE